MSKLNNKRRGPKTIEKREKMKITKSLRNNSGIILITVILLTIVLTIVAIGMMSINVSQVTSAQSVIDSIKAEQLATGVFFQRHQLQAEGCPNPPCTTAGDCSTCPAPAAETLDGKTFAPTITIQSPTSPACGGTGTLDTPNCTDQVDVQIDY